MASNKRSARAKQRALFEASVGAELDDIFASERRHTEDAARNREAHRQHKACGSKNRYASYAEADRTRLECEAYGTRGLHIYQCEYCGGWHLTSKPQESRSQDAG